MKDIYSDSYISVSDVYIYNDIFLKCFILVLLKISGMKMNKISSDFDLVHRYIFFLYLPHLIVINNMSLYMFFLN